MREERAIARKDTHPESSLVALQRRISGCTDLGELLDELASGLGPLLPVDDRVSIAFLEPDGEWMRIYRVLPRGEDLPGRLPRVRVEGTPVGQVVRAGAGRVIEDVRTDPNITFGHASRERIRSTLSVPVWVGGRIMGAMNAGSTVAGACTEEMLGQLEDIATIAGPAIYAAEQVFLLMEERERIARAKAALEEEIAGDRPAGLVGAGAEFRSLLAAARLVARSDADVLITGETGVGKTAFARAMHRWSERRDGPFVTVHLADLSPTIIESELFGHERGAFTGALEKRAGRFESARGGTIFLDEVAEAPLPVQAKLLRVIQDRCFERVGGSRTLDADVRIMAATSRDLRELVARREFREDLFFRLDVVPLRVPPLRERIEDLELLVDQILSRLVGSAGRLRRLAPAAWRRLRAYHWPGNIRELESVLRRATILEAGDELRLEGFSDRVSSQAPAARDWPTLEEHQRRYIVEVLELSGGVIEGPEGAAQLLGMCPSTLRSRMNRLGISACPMRAKGQR
jgi:transcriptional regulator with GAF, ATPase, and Fis domain